ncbi:hypothetical protein [Planctomyces sp. SH-PL14]|uniref:hypothetical protein n=1 Tax=Planctomyces sp. SH-PL14 TaxID=1632864 RepID=UPI00078CEE71|nr:hypothetical protein [Planctomyces sp. SH-PL14]AMV16581.1 hypothetical protein VT03_01745 [Planctomyces sp. SH-PL14]
MSWEIPTRSGVEVYVSQGGFVCLKQEDDQHCEGYSIVALDKELIPQTIEFLQAALELANNGAPKEQAPSRRRPRVAAAPSAEEGSAPPASVAG